MQRHSGVSSKKSNCPRALGHPCMLAPKLAHDRSMPTILRKSAGACSQRPRADTGTALERGRHRPSPPTDGCGRQCSVPGLASCSVATVFWSTAVSASQASSISTIHRSLPTDALSRPAAAVSPRVTFPKRSHERLDGGGPVSHVRRFIRERPRCPGNYSHDAARNHRDRRE